MAYYNGSNTLLDAFPYTLPEYLDRLHQLISHFTITLSPMSVTITKGCVSDSEPTIIQNIRLIGS